MTGDRPVALVTGAAGAIGAATVDALAREGFTVAAGWRSSVEPVDAQARQLHSEGLCAVPLRMDVTDPASVDEAVDQIEATLGRVGVLVNNAGVTHDGAFLRMSPEQWRSVLGVNLDGAFNVARRLAPNMARARWGRIVNVTSVVAMSGSAGQVNYASAKAGLVGLTRSLARELAGRSVTVNAVAPGPIRSPMLDACGEQRVEAITDSVPLKRLGEPTEVAAAISYLCSPQAAYITGAVVPVDGGLGMGH